MSNYTKSTNFAVKDGLVTGNPAKIIKGTEIDAEYNIAEYALAEYGGTVFDNKIINIGGTGKVIQLGFETDINAKPACLS